MAASTSAKAETVAQYLAALPPERKKVLAAVRKTIRANLPKGYREGIQYGMVGWFVPHSVYEKGYHCDPSQPVPFISLASQKNHMAVYLFCLYCDPAEMAAFQERWKADTGRLDMGKSCVRFKSLEQVSLDAIAEAVKRMPVEKFIASYESAWVRPRGGGKQLAKKASKKASKKTSKKAHRNAGVKVSGEKAGRSAAKKAGRRGA